jgi:hypothetical protein
MGGHMSLHLPIPLIDNALGGSVIYEECKGDFAKAQLKPPSRHAFFQKAKFSLMIRPPKRRFAK